MDGIAVGEEEGRTALSRFVNLMNAGDLLRAGLSLVIATIDRHPSHAKRTEVLEIACGILRSGVRKALATDPGPSAGFCASYLTEKD